MGLGKVTPAGIFVVAVVLRLLWWSVAVFYGNYDFMTTDSHQYLRAAHNLIDHHSFSLAREAPYSADMFRTPGYPLFLTPFVAMNLSSIVIALLQTLAGAAIPVLVFQTARRLGFASAVLGASLLVIDTSLMVFIPLLLSDGLFALLLALLIYSLAANQQDIKCLIWQALLLGGLILIRPIAAYLPILLLLWWLIHRVKSWHFVVAAGVLFALPGGWVLRNYYTLQTPAISTVGQTGLFLYWAAGTHALANGKDFEEVQKFFLLEAYEAYDWNNEPGVNAKYMRYARERTIEEVRKHPVEAVRIAAANGVYFFFKPPRGYFDLALGLSRGYSPVGAQADQRGWVERIRAVSATTSAPAMALSAWQLVLNLIQFALAIAGLLALWRVNRKWFWLIFLVVGYFWFFSMFTQTDARFRLPALPLMALAAAAIPFRKRALTIDA